MHEQKVSNTTTVTMLALPYNAESIIVRSATNLKTQDPAEWALKLLKVRKQVDYPQSKSYVKMPVSA